MKKLSLDHPERALGALQATFWEGNGEVTGMEYIIKHNENDTKNTRQ
jgi:hypothetical protein